MKRLFSKDIIYIINLSKSRKEILNELQNHKFKNLKRKKFKWKNVLNIRK
jgi:hypothetical protein